MSLQQIRRRSLCRLSPANGTFRPCSCSIDGKCRLVCLGSGQILVISQLTYETAIMDTRDAVPCRLSKASSFKNSVECDHQISPRVLLRDVLAPGTQAEADVTSSTRHGIQYAAFIIPLLPHPKPSCAFPVIASQASGRTYRSPQDNICSNALRVLCES